MTLSINSWLPIATTFCWVCFFYFSRHACMSICMCDTCMYIQMYAESLQTYTDLCMQVFFIVIFHQFLQRRYINKCPHICIHTCLHARAHLRIVYLTIYIKPLRETLKSLWMVLYSVKDNRRWHTWTNKLWRVANVKLPIWTDWGSIDWAFIIAEGLQERKTQHSDPAFVHWDWNR